MRTTTIALLTGSGALVAGLLGTPAVADRRSDKIADASNVMLQERDVTATLGLPVAQDFDASYREQVPLWICRTTRDYQGKTPTSYYHSSIELDDLFAIRDVTQHVWVYKRTKTVKRVWANLVKKARNCTGTYKHGNWQTPGGKKFKWTLHNGRTWVYSYGKRGVWIRGDFEAAAHGQLWAADEYGVYLRSGRSIQMTELDVDALNDNFSKAERKAVQRLARKLANRWSDKLGPNWH